MAGVQRWATSLGTTRTAGVLPRVKPDRRVELVAWATGAGVSMIQPPIILPSESIQLRGLAAELSAPDDLSPRWLSFDALDSRTNIFPALDSLIAEALHGVKGLGDRWIWHLIYGLDTAECQLAELLAIHCDQQDLKSDLGVVQFVKGDRYQEFPEGAEHAHVQIWLSEQCGFEARLVAQLVLDVVNAIDCRIDQLEQDFQTVDSGALVLLPISPLLQPVRVLHGPAGRCDCKDRSHGLNPSSPIGLAPTKMHAERDECGEAKQGH